MKTTGATVTALLMVFLTFCVEARAAEFLRGDRIEVIGKYTDNVFAAGGQIQATLQSTDDIFLAGGKIIFSGETSESLWAAGGDLVLQNAQTRNAILAGGSLSIEGVRLRELIAAGGEIHIRKSVVQDDLILTGGEIFVDADSKIEGSTMVSGGEVTLSGHFAGDVRIYAREVHLAPTTVISGKLTYAADEIEISEGARITGETIILPGREEQSEAFGIFGALVFFIGSLLVAPILVFLFSRVIVPAQSEIRTRFWESLGRGTALALLIPVGVIVLFISVIGIPIALTLIPFLMVFGLLAWTLFIFSLAAWIRNSILKKQDLAPLDGSRLFWWTLLGSVVVMVILWIPVIGFLFMLVGFLSGLGALSTMLQQHLGRRVFV